MSKSVLNVMYCILSLSFLSHVCAQTIPVKKVLFFGIMEDGSPAFNETFDYMFRSRISAQAGISVVDYELTRAYREKIEFSRYHSISTGLVDKLQKILPDSLLLCWGRIVSADVQPKRKKIFSTVFSGSASVAITIFNPEQRVYVFNGIISKGKDVPGPPVYFRSVSKSVTVSALQRTKIINELLEDIASQSVSLITSLLQNNQSLEAGVFPTEDQESGVPSISDVFSVPSVEAPGINNENDNENQDTAGIKNQDTEDNTAGTETK